MIQVRASDDRGSFDFGWLSTRHSFSFGHYRDPAHMGFRSLRVINEDVVRGGAGFPEHGHEEMEIISYVLSGGLSHRDSLGHVETLRPGDVQRMTAGQGIQHSEFNASKTEPVHFLQIWIRPGKARVTPGYEQKFFPESERRGRLRLVVSPDGAEGSITINQDARLYASIMSAGDRHVLPINQGRHAWVQVARGGVTVNGTLLGAGDGAAVTDERELAIQARADSEILVFDLA